MKPLYWKRDVTRLYLFCLSRDKMKLLLPNQNRREKELLLKSFYPKLKKKYVTKIINNSWINKSHNNDKKTKLFKLITIQKRVSTLLLYHILLWTKNLKLLLTQMHKMLLQVSHHYCYYSWKNFSRLSHLIWYTNSMKNIYFFWPDFLRILCTEMEKVNFFSVDKISKDWRSSKS